MNKNGKITQIIGAVVDVNFYTDLPEINRLELFTVIPLLIITVFFGIYPAPYLDIISSTMDHIINHVVSLATFASM